MDDIKEEGIAGLTPLIQAGAAAEDVPPIQGGGLGSLAALASLSAAAAQTAPVSRMKIEDVELKAPTPSPRSSRKRKLTAKAQENLQKRRRGPLRAQSGAIVTTRSGRTVRRSRRSVAAAAAIDDRGGANDTSTEEEEERRIRKRGSSAQKSRRRSQSDHATLETLFSVLEREPTTRVSGRGSGKSRRGSAKKRGRRGNESEINALSTPVLVGATRRIDDSRVKIRSRSAIGTNATRAIVPTSASKEALKQLKVALKSKKFRTFCRQEFFLSAIDRLYFEQNDFVECLFEHGLGEITKVSRAEWSYIRSILGKPRRLSRAFFREERDKLERYRNDVRCIQQGHTILCDEFPFPEEVPARLSEGQPVVALHPSTNELHTGVVVQEKKGVKNTKQGKSPPIGHYFVKFDQETLQTVNVPDTSVMPYGRIHSSLSKLQHPIGPRFPHASGDAYLVANLLRLLDRKEALLTHLRTMNDQVEMISKTASDKEKKDKVEVADKKIKEEKEANGKIEAKVVDEKDSKLEKMGDKPSPQPNGNNIEKKNVSLPLAFKQQYAWVVVELEHSSKALDDALQAMRLRQSGISLGEAGSDLSVHVSHSCYQRARELMETLKGKLLSTGDLSFKSGAPETSKINNLIVCCMSLVLLIQFCAERGLQPLGLDAVLESVRPTRPENQGLFRKIEECVRKMQSLLSAI